MYEGRKTFAIIPAAGSGSRMGLPYSKLLCQLQGEEILIKTFRALAQDNWCDTFILACRSTDREQFSVLLNTLNVAIEFVEGGQSRQESVRNALCHLKKQHNPSDDSLVLVHDAARTFVSPDLISRCLASAAISGATTAAVNCVDTIYQVDSQERLIKPLLERKQLRAIQTPQVFRFDLLWQAHQNSSLRASDDAGLVSQIAEVVCIEGEVANIKVTLPSDL